MRRGSSTSRSDGARLLVACVALLVSADAAGARPWPCLPPVFDGGQRMHQMPVPTVFWLELLLRQHELCWREPAAPEETRIALFGNSAVYGALLPVGETFASRLNRRLGQLGVPARIFNLGFVYTYQIRDAVVIHAALRYEPDVLVYALTLGEFSRVPPFFLPAVRNFFDSNRDVTAQMLAEPPPGLVDAFERNRTRFTGGNRESWLLRRMRAAGGYLRIAARAHAAGIAAFLGAPPPPLPASPSLGRRTTYDCARTLASNDDEFRNWKEWNILAYLEHIQRTRGIPVLVVDWPLAYEPVGDCYNLRFGKAVLADYHAWMRRETSARGLRYLDLHDGLAADAFLDSLHLGAKGHQWVAGQLERALGPLLD